MKSDDIKVNYFFTIIRRRFPDGELVVVEKEMFTDYGLAAKFGMSRLCDEPRVTFAIYHLHSLPVEFRGWALERIRKFHATRIGDLVLF